MKPALLAVTLALLSACGGSTEPKVSVAGNYSLAAFRSSPLPYNLGLGVSLVSGNLALNASGSYLSTYQTSSVQVGMGPDGGRWSAAGTILTLTDTSNLSVSTAIVAGDSLRFGDGTVYRRR